MVDTEKILDIEKALSGINWFVYAGNVSITLKQEEYMCVQVRTMREASESIHSLAWNNQIKEAQNKLSSFLRISYNEEFKNWNDVADEALDSFRKMKEKICRQCSKQRFHEDFFSSIKSTYIRIYIELYYKNLIGVPVFFTYLLDIYKRGKLPCGWLPIKEEVRDNNRSMISEGSILVW